MSSHILLAKIRVVLVAYECFHYLRKKKSGIKGYMALKLDMSKAYDRVEWVFLQKMMEKMKFPDSFTDLIMKCVSSPTFAILVNGQPTKTFSSSRGLRQGDPMSPFLFVLCAEGLSALLRDAEKKQLIHGVKIGRRVEAISHLLFADDSLLFARANEEEVEQVIDILSIYEGASGQKLNMEKSVMSFSRNVGLEKKNLLLNKLKFKAVDDYDKYLGLPTCLGSSKKAIFQTIQDRVWKKLKGWKEKFLSQAGREVLIKSIGQAITMYAMQCFKIPISIIVGIEKIIRGFFWGQKSNERKIPWLSWENVCRTKKEGGLGLRDMEAFNMALLAKQGWRLLTEENTLMTRVLKGKYFPNNTFMEAKMSTNGSYTWKSILQAREILTKGSQRVIGNGMSTRIWHDPWVPRMGREGLLSRREAGEGRGELVSALIENGRWNGQKIHEVFSSWEGENIRQLILPLYPCEDYWSWKYTKDGCFSVKSAYHLAVKNKKFDQATSSAESSPQLWKKVWSACTPPKVRNFAWRALNNALPVGMNFVRRKISVDPICSRCVEDIEDLKHLILTCPASKKIWYLSPLRLEVNITEEMSFKEWVERRQSIMKEKEWWSIFWAVCWAIWLGRNGWLFNKEAKEYMWSIGKATGMVEEYRKAMEMREVKQCNTPPLNGVWFPPPRGKTKLNTDAGIKAGGKVGLGAVLRDDVGDVLVAMCDKWEGECSVLMAEAMALREGMKTVLEAGFHSLMVEVDNATLYEAVRKKKKDQTSLGLILHDIFVLSEQCSFYSIDFIRREGNQVAHCLAKHSLELEELKVWLEEIPADVLPLVMRDVS